MGKSLTRWLRVATSNPSEAWDRLVVKFGNLSAGKAGTAAYEYDADPRWEERVHGWLVMEWPCDAGKEFDSLWTDLVTSAPRELGIDFGRGHDADPTLARAVWCVSQHLAIDKVIETGVARGLTSRYLLQSMDRQNAGHLWSIDMPPLSDPWYEQVGIAVPSSLRRRWTYMRGSSRRLLPSLCENLGSVDLTVLDSCHTDEHIRFELETVWKVLRPGGVVVVDDIDGTEAFHDFLHSRRCLHWAVCAHEKKEGQFGIALK